MKKKILLFTIIIALAIGIIPNFVLTAQASADLPKAAKLDEVQQWYRNPTLYGDKLNDIIFANDVFVAVGANGAIKTSTDGQTWIKRESKTGGELKTIIWTGKKFIAAGSKGTIVYSKDGVNWEVTDSITEFTIYSIAYNGKMYVAVGENNLIMTSVDGIKWTLVQEYIRFLEGENDYSILAHGEKYKHVVGDKGVQFRNVEWYNDKFVIASDSWHSNNYSPKDSLLISKDGKTWEKLDLDSEIFIGKIYKMSDQFVGCTYDGIAATKDGLEWDATKIATSAYVTAIAYNDEKYVAVGRSSEIYISQDLKSWNSVLNTQYKWGLGILLNSVAYGNGVFVAVGDSELIAVSNDGELWATVDKGYRNINDIAYSGETYVLCGNGFVFSSKDGAAWEKTYDTNGYQLTSVSYINDKFIVVGHGYILISEDGYNWTRTDNGIFTNNGTYEICKNIVWNGEVYLISAQFNILISKDGYEWSKVELPEDFRHTHNVIWNGERFVFVTYGAKGWTLVTSTDGVNWKSEPCSIIKENEMSFYEMFLAEGNGHYVMMKGVSIYYSDDGLTWEKVQHLNRSVTYPNINRDVTYIKWNGTCFIAHLWEGKILVSEDGKVWKDINVGYGSIINGLIQDEKGFLAVGNNGLLLASYDIFEEKYPLKEKSPVLVVAEDNSSIIIDGSEKLMDPLMDIQSFGDVVKNNGGLVSWDNKEKRVTVQLNGSVINMWTNQNTVRINNNISVLDTAPQYVNGSTMVPARFILESLGYTFKRKGDTPDSWAEKEVNEATELKLVPENMQNNYKENITREDFCNLIINLVSVKSGKDIDVILIEKGLELSQNPFVDTTDKAIIAANKLGIVNGRGNGVFDPTGNISRQEAAVMLANTSKLFVDNISAAKSTFADNNEIASWAQNAVNYVYSKGIMGGVGGNMFSPKASYTRQQAYITMLRLFKSL